MKTSKIKTVRNIGRIRTLLVTLSVAVCLATLMGCGNSPEKDASPADDIERLRQAAEQGNAEAQYDLGLMYADGEGVPSDSAEAAKWYRKAAEQGHAQAQYTLGEMCENDFNFMMYKSFTYSEAYAEAVKWYRKAAEQGHAEGQSALGSMYRKGRGVPEDDVEAAKWYRMAAENGHAWAQFNLAVKYDTGEEGVPEDDAEAAKWYRKAAEQGHARAQYRLGVMYRYGRGVPQDYVAAYAWYIVAAASGDDDLRKKRDIIKRELKPSQVEKGEVLAREISERIEKR